MSDVIRRWRSAAERAATEGVRVIQVDGSYLATSSSQPLGGYRLSRSADGWTCECTANSKYGQPCKHLWVLVEALSLDPLSDIHLDHAELFSSPLSAA